MSPRAPLPLSLLVGVVALAALATLPAFVVADSSWTLTLSGAVTGTVTKASCSGSSVYFPVPYNNIGGQVTFTWSLGTQTSVTRTYENFDTDPTPITGTGSTRSAIVTLDSDSSTGDYDFRMTPSSDYCYVYFQPQSPPWSLAITGAITRVVDSTSCSSGSQHVQVPLSAAGSQLLFTWSLPSSSQTLSEYTESFNTPPTDITNNMATITLDSADTSSSSEYYAFQVYSSSFGSDTCYVYFDLAPAKWNATALFQDSTFNAQVNADLCHDSGSSPQTIFVPAELALTSASLLWTFVENGASIIPYSSFCYGDVEDCTAIVNNRVNFTLPDVGDSGDIDFSVTGGTVCYLFFKVQAPRFFVALSGGLTATVTTDSCSSGSQHIIVPTAQAGSVVNLNWTIALGGSVAQTGEQFITDPSPIINNLATLTLNPRAATTATEYYTFTISPGSFSCQIYFDPQPARWNATAVFDTDSRYIVQINAETCSGGSSNPQYISVPGQFASTRAGLVWTLEQYATVTQSGSGCYGLSACTDIVNNRVNFTLPAVSGQGDYDFIISPGGLVCYVYFQMQATPPATWTLALTGAVTESVDKTRCASGSVRIPVAGTLAGSEVLFTWMISVAGTVAETYESFRVEPTPIVSMSGVAGGFQSTVTLDIGPDTSSYYTFQVSPLNPSCTIYFDMDTTPAAQWNAIVSFGDAMEPINAGNCNSGNTLDVTVPYMLAGSMASISFNLSQGAIITDASCSYLTGCTAIVDRRVNFTLPAAADYGRYYFTVLPGGSACQVQLNVEPPPWNVTVSGAVSGMVSMDMCRISGGSVHIPVPAVLAGQSASLLFSLTMGSTVSGNCYGDLDCSSMVNMMVDLTLPTPAETGYYSFTVTAGTSCSIVFDVDPPTWNVTVSGAVSTMVTAEMCRAGSSGSSSGTYRVRVPNTAALRSITLMWNLTAPGGVTGDCWGYLEDCTPIENLMTTMQLPGLDETGYYSFTVSPGSQSCGLYFDVDPPSWSVSTYGAVETTITDVMCFNGEVRIPVNNQWAQKPVWMIWTLVSTATVSGTGYYFTDYTNIYGMRANMTLPMQDQSARYYFTVSPGGTPCNVYYDLGSQASSSFSWSGVVTATADGTTFTNSALTWTGTSTQVVTIPSAQAISPATLTLLLTEGASLVSGLPLTSSSQTFTTPSEGQSMSYMFQVRGADNVAGTVFHIIITTRQSGCTSDDCIGAGQVGIVQFATEYTQSTLPADFDQTFTDAAQQALSVTGVQTSHTFGSGPAPMSHAKNIMVRRRLLADGDVAQVRVDFMPMDPTDTSAFQMAQELTRQLTCRGSALQTQAQCADQSAYNTNRRTVFSTVPSDWLFASNVRPDSVQNTFEPYPHKDSGLTQGQKAGIAIGVLLFVAILLGVFFFYKKRSQNTVRRTDTFNNLDKEQQGVALSQNPIRSDMDFTGRGAV